MTVTAYLSDMWKLVVSGEEQGIVFLFSLYMFVVCFYSLVFQIRTRRWPSVQGRLLDIGLAKFGNTSVLSDQNFVASALYQYRVSGVLHDGRRISPWFMLVTYNLKCLIKWQLSRIQPSSDGKVTVYYHPDKHHKSYLIVPGKAGMVFTGMICVLPFILFYSKYH